MPDTKRELPKELQLSNVAERVAKEILGWKRHVGKWHRADGTCTGFKVATKIMHHIGDGYFRPDRHFADLAKAIDVVHAKYHVRHNFRALQHRYICWIDNREGERIVEADIALEGNAHASNECCCELYLAFWNLPRDEAGHIVGVDNGPE